STPEDLPTSVFQVPISVERFYLRESLRALLHSILFHRLIGPIRPRVLELSSLDVSYARIDDSDIERTVEERITTFVKALDSSPTPPTLSVSFLMRQRRHSLFRGQYEEDVCWERWDVGVKLRTARNDAEHAQSKRVLERDLESALIRISQLSNDTKEHIPAVNSLDNPPFPWNIVITAPTGFSSFFR
ncbi:hypothetical protein M427DRAFT_274740, partial [Gonapodya prolifera JEL478]